MMKIYSQEKFAPEINPMCPKLPTEENHAARPLSLCQYCIHGGHMNCNVIAQQTTHALSLKI